MKTLTKSVIGVSAALLAGAVALTPVLVTAWGDSANGRKTYTLEQVREGQLGETVTFNSITNGAIGDERNFVAAKPQSSVANTGVAWNADTIQVKDGETYTIRLYVHNNNAPKKSEVEQGKGGVSATNVRANFSLPTTVGKSLTAIGYISAPNATPTKYWDEVTFTSDDDFYVEYVKGSATYSNNAGTFKLPDEVIVGQGALLGYDKMDGTIPGCYQYDGEVHIDVTVHKSVTANLDKKVRVKGTKDWSEGVNAKVGDEVEYQIEYTNFKDESVKNVILRDILPTNVEYVPGSTMLYNSNNPNWVTLKENTFTTSGINVGDFAPKGNAYVRFTGKVVDKTLACGANQLVNWANATTDGQVTAKDDASVMVNKTCNKTPDQPSQPEPDQPTTDEPGSSVVPTPSTPSNTTTTSATVETPTTIVSTGPEGIAAGALGAGGTVTALGYAIASRKKEL